MTQDVVLEDEALRRDLVALDERDGGIAARRRRRRGRNRGRRWGFCGSGLLCSGVGGRRGRGFVCRRRRRCRRRFSSSFSSSFSFSFSLWNLQLLLLLVLDGHHHLDVETDPHEPGEVHGRAVGCVDLTVGVEHDRLAEREAVAAVAAHLEQRDRAPYEVLVHGRGVDDRGGVFGGEETGRGRREGEGEGGSAGDGGGGGRGRGGLVGGLATGMLCCNCRRRSTVPPPVRCCCRCARRVGRDAAVRCAGGEIHCRA